MTNEVNHNHQKTMNDHRNYLFDNMRAILIFTVVTGHMLREQLGYSNILDSIYYFIYLFHMPAFIFITGYFSKNVEKSRAKAFQSFFIPYILINTLYWLYDKFILSDITKPFRVFKPEWGMWFFLAVFVWKLMLKDLIRIRFIIPLSFLIGLFSGFSGEFTQKLALARILSFAPFFILGYYCNETVINRIRKIPKFISILTLMAFSTISYVIVKYDIFPIEHFFMRNSYSKVRNGMFNDIIIRSFLYMSAVIITISLINLISKRKKSLSIIGQNSVTVYIIHLFIVINLRRLEFPWDGTNYYIIYTFIIALAVSYLCSRPIVLNVYNYIMDRITSFIIKQPE